MSITMAEYKLAWKFDMENGLENTGASTHMVYKL